uniref:TGF-beta family profile domain-containing protein n=1 Tax=Salmo trutta TaxID=8032 RepID=A0A673YYL6_SALTR
MVVFSKHQTKNRAPTLIRTADRERAGAGPAVSVEGGKGARRRKRHGLHQRAGAAGVAPGVAHTEKRKGPLCKKVDMWVDFDQIAWSEWILYTKRYNAYRCEGSCPTPVNETFTPTNHAYMQVRLPTLHYHSSPLRPVPVPVLEVLMQHFEGMVVDECGCH